MEKEKPGVTKQVESIKETKPTKPKKSFLSKISSFFGLEDSSAKEDETVETMAPIEDPSMQKMIELKEDLKQVAVIATGILPKLPKDEFQAFKNSEEFARFKAILKKNNIIKEK